MECKIRIEPYGSYNSNNGTTSKEKGYNMTSKEYKKVIGFILNDLDTRDQLKLMTLIKEKLELHELAKEKQ